MTRPSTVDPRHRATSRVLIGGLGVVVGVLAVGLAALVRAGLADVGPDRMADAAALVTATGFSAGTGLGLRRLLSRS